MAGGSNDDDDRLFVRDGWRHYRRTYSLPEVRCGLACFAALLVITGWVLWKGRHPDPALFADGTALLDPAAKAPQVAVGAPSGTAPAPAAAERVAAPATAAPAQPAGEVAAAVGRGPLPRGLAGSGFSEGPVLQYTEDNLYEKIDGRADYFRAFQFRRLHSVLLTSDRDSAVTIDVEMYDVATNPNALGAYSGERPPNAKVVVTDAGLHHFDRNALYLARGPFYIRVIGSDETPVVTEKLAQIAEKMLADVGGEPLPWAYGLYIGQMNIGADKITYSAKNAFSLAFADDVWAARPKGKETDLELFVSARKDGAAAKALVGQLHKAFLELGAPAGKAGAGGPALVKDQFLGLISAVKPQGRYVIGVRGADGPATAAAELGRLGKAVAAAEVVTAAKPAAGAESPLGTSGGGPAPKDEGAAEAEGEK
jgi:hypothetical protein